MSRLALLISAVALLAMGAEAQTDPARGVDLLVAATPTATPAEAAPGELARFEASFDAQSIESRAVRPGDFVRLALPVQAQEYRVSRVDNFSGTTVSVAGVADDGSGDVMALTFHHDGAAGVVTAGGTLYHLMWSDGRPVLVEVDPRGVDALECGVTEAEMPHGQLDLSLESMAHAAAPFSMMSLGDYTDDLITIDVVLAYTANARNWSIANHGSIDSVIAQMMNLSQLALDNSEIHVYLRVVHSYETDYDETIPNMPGVGASSSHLRRFTAGPHYNPWGSAAAGYMEEIHDLRDEYGADLASLLAEVGGFGGVAWLLGNIVGSPLHGFSVNRVQQMATGYTFVHEVGHNMGSHHSRNQSSAAAPARGGIFPYSTGWRFDAPENPSANTYATVMTYAQSGSPRVPYFSNPDVSLEGVPTGAYSGSFAPADNARSMRETKRIIASYRPTLFEPPVADVSPSVIEITADGGQASATLEIGNSGESSLMWDLDVRPAGSQRPAGGAHAVAADASVEVGGLYLAAGGNHVSPPTSMRVGGMIYETDFSSADGFNIGTHQQASEWASRVNASPFWILSSNPSIGSQHMRIGVTSSGNSATVHSPFLGMWPTGGYEVSFDVFVNDVGPLYTIAMRDGRTGEPTAGVAYQATGQLLVMTGVTTDGSPIYGLSGQTWTADVYQSVTVRVRPEEGEVDYLLDGVPFSTRPLVGGTSFGQLQIGRGTGYTGVYMDLDNVSVKQLYPGFDWVSIDTWSGVTHPGEGSTINLEFDGADLGPGIHDAVLVLRTNLEDPDEIEIPIQLNVVLSNEGGPGEAADRLLGNHPNPARGSTAVTYELAQPGQVVLELFSVTGQRVRVLVDEYRSAGTHEARLDTASLASGVYFYRLTTDSAVDSGRLVVVR